MRWSYIGLMVLLIAVTVRCSDPAEPNAAAPTVLVDNPLCDSAGCDTLYLRAFVWAFPIPQGEFRGAKPFGYVSVPARCLQFPDKWTITLREVDSLGVPVSSDSTVFSWTPDHPDGVYLIAWSSTSYLDRTQTFVPASASGWKLSFTKEQDAGPLTVHLAAAPPCDPR